MKIYSVNDFPKINNIKAQACTPKSTNNYFDTVSFKGTEEEKSVESPYRRIEYEKICNMFKNFSTNTVQKSRDLQSEAVSLELRAKGLVAESHTTLHYAKEGKLQFKRAENGTLYIEEPTNDGHKKTYLTKRDGYLSVERIEEYTPENGTTVYNINKKGDVDEIICDQRKSDEYSFIAQKMFFFRHGSLDMVMNDLKRKNDGSFNVGTVYKYINGVLYNSSKNFTQEVDGSTTTQCEGLFKHNKLEKLNINRIQRMNGDFTIAQAFFFENEIPTMLEKNFKRNRMGEVTIEKSFKF